MQYSIRCTPTAVHRDAEVFVCFFRTIYANMTPFSFLNRYRYIMKTLSSLFSTLIMFVWLENAVGICLHRDSLWIYIYFLSLMVG